MKTRFWLVMIFILALFLRVFVLDTLPFGFTPDEASFGYDAYSILRTGKDQWGHTLPLVLESFGDFKPPLYSYLSIPSVYFLGLSRFSIRLTNAFLGSLAVVVIYYLVKELKFLRNNKQKSFLAVEFLPLLSSFFLTISPWHVMMSRGAFEANLTTFLMPLGVLFFLKGFKKEKYLLYSSIIFGLNLFSYHSARLVTPVIVFMLIVLFWKRIKNIDTNKLIFPVFIFLVFLSAAFYTLTIGGAARAKDISVFSGSLEEASEDRFIAAYQGIDPFVARLYHNKYIVTFDRFVSNYSQYLSAEFLFLNGPAEATYGMTPGSGVLYLIEALFLIAFLYRLVSDKDKRGKLFILLWILVAPIPAALAQGRGFAANRAVIMIPAITIASAMGAVFLLNLLSKLVGKKSLGILKLTLFAVITLSFFGFFEKYFFLSPYKFSKEMLYGNLEAAEWLKENIDVDENVVVSRGLSEPHIYIAFTNKWDPDSYQKNTKDWERYREANLKFLDQLGEYSLGNYTFRSIYYNEDQRLFGTYLVGRPDEFNGSFDLAASFISPSGEPYVYITKPVKEVYASKTN